jgi:hypothetical protein
MHNLQRKLALIVLIFFTLACGEDCHEGEDCGEDTPKDKDIHSCLVNYDKRGQVPCPVDTTTSSSGK